MLHITPVYASLLALLLVALSVHVIRGRRRAGAALGDAGDPEMTRRIRAHGNLAEYAPMFCLLLAFAEMNAALPPLALHLTGALFCLGRLSHANGVLFGERYAGMKLLSGLAPRVIGMMCTFVSLAVLSVSLLLSVALS